MVSHSDVWVLMSPFLLVPLTSLDVGEIELYTVVSQGSYATLYGRVTGILCHLIRSCHRNLMPLYTSCHSDLMPFYAVVSQGSYATSYGRVTGILCHFIRSCHRDLMPLYTVVSLWVHVFVATGILFSSIFVIPGLFLKAPRWSLIIFIKLYFFTILSILLISQFSGNASVSMSMVSQRSLHDTYRWTSIVVGCYFIFSFNKLSHPIGMINFSLVFYFNFTIIFINLLNNCVWSCLLSLLYILLVWL